MANNYTVIRKLAYEILINNRVYVLETTKNSEGNRFKNVTLRNLENNSRKIFINQKLVMV